MSYRIDGSAYFAAFREAALRARHSLMLIGWDFDSRFRLLREEPEDGLPSALRPFLNALVARRPDLQVYVLNWDFAWLMALDREWASRMKMDWVTQERFQYRFDAAHPSGASHHQKIVVIDDRLAFVGGLDFTRGRWDSSDHAPGDKRREDPFGNVAQPYHDVQAMLQGNVAADLGELLRRRWKAATGETVERPPRSDHVLWPDSVDVDLHDVSVGVARTLPKHEGQDEVREIEVLLSDMIERAERWIYIENQYFTSAAISDALAARLGEKEGPEVVMVLPRETVGWLSQQTMDKLREHHIRRLRDADCHGRFRVYYPEVPGLGEECVNVHSKVMVIDDELLTIGSANLNNRSFGLDSECNVAVEAAGDRSTRRGVANLRDRLLAEHLDCTADMVADRLSRCGSLIETIEQLRSKDRSLRELQLRHAEDDDATVPIAQLADPEREVDADYLARTVLGDSVEPNMPAWRRLAGLVGMILLALALAAAWRWTPLGEWIDLQSALDRMSELSGQWFAPLAVIAIYTVGSLLMIPVTLMIVATGLAFGAWFGFGYALLGAVTSALIIYFIGHAVGHKAVQMLPENKVSRVSRFVGKKGLPAMIVLRIVPVAPFTVVNLVAGASHIRLRDYALGTLLGMVPGVLALVVLSDRIVAAVRSPGPLQLAILLGLAVLLAVGSWAAKRWLGGRSPA